MIVFSAQNEQYRKRKRVHRACDQCRKRRRRCEPSPDEVCALCHKDGLPCSLTIADALPGGPSRTVSAQSVPVSRPYGMHSINSEYMSSVLPTPGEEPKEGVMNGAPPGQSPNESIGGSAITRKGGKVSRFVGDLNPESQLLEKTPSSRATSRASSHERGDIGVWIKHGRQRKNSDNGVGKQEVLDPRSPSSDSSEVEPQGDIQYAAVVALEAHIKAAGFNLPQDADVRALLEVFFSHVNNVIPVLDEEAFRHAYDRGRVPLVLLLAVILVACRHESAKPHLRFDIAASPLEPRVFARAIHSALAALLKAEVETDKLTLIQTLMLASMHAEGPQGNETASLHLSTAVHHAGTIGLHLPRNPGSSDDRRTLRLFWSLWSLDRLNAGINGRAVFIHERDVAERPATFCEDASEKARYGAFDLWLKVSGLLDKVIALYRPSKDPATPWEHGFPTFEEVVGEDGENLTPDQIAMFELFYHSVAILSCRLRPSTPLPPSAPSRILQSLSALRIVKIAAEENLGMLPPIPVIPYALTLSMTVAYRQFREAKLPMHKARARTDWEKAHRVLAELGNQWWSAEALANLGQQAMDRVERKGKSPGKDSTSPGQTVVTSTESAISGGDRSATSSTQPVPFPINTSFEHSAPESGFSQPQHPLSGGIQQPMYGETTFHVPNGGPSTFDDFVIPFLQPAFPDPTYNASFLDPLLWDDNQMWGTYHGGGPIG